MKKSSFQRHWPAVILIGIILAWRFFQIRSLALPAWVDSVHHALLVRILLEQGALPLTWEPYLPQVPFYYHFGFHLTAALFAKSSGVSVGQAVLIVGQIWQALLALAVYLLAYTLWQSPKKALTATILVSFVSQMPGYYTTWGRYTLVAGLTLMIFAMAAALAKRRVGLAILVAATAFTHYYAFLLLCLFLLITMLAVPTKRYAVLTGWAGGVLLASPWLWNVFVQVNRRSLVYVQAGADSVGYSTDYLWYLLGPSRNYVLLFLSALGAAIIAAHMVKSHSLRTANAAPVLCWSLVIIALIGPWRFGPFRPDHHAALVLFLPVALFATEAVWRLPRSALIWGMVLMLTLWGGWETKNIINPATVLANENDVAALEWIEANTAPDANFLIDVAPWSAQWRGADGGWWITPYTGRQTVLPPAAYGWGQPETVQHIRATAARIYALSWVEQTTYCDELIALMLESAATHYYTRSRLLGRCPTLQPVYQGRGDVTIFSLNQAKAQAPLLTP